MRKKEKSGEKRAKICTYRKRKRSKKRKMGKFFHLAPPDR